MSMIPSWLRYFLFTEDDPRRTPVSKEPDRSGWTPPRPMPPSPRPPSGLAVMEERLAARRTPDPIRRPAPPPSRIVRETVYVDNTPMFGQPASVFGYYPNTGSFGSTSHVVPDQPACTPAPEPAPYVYEDNGTQCVAPTPAPAPYVYEAPAPYESPAPAPYAPAPSPSDPSSD